MRRRKSSNFSKKMMISVCIVGFGLITGGCLFGAVSSTAAEEKAVANKPWSEVERVVETKLGTGYEAAGKCTGYLYWCLKNAYGVDMGTNSVVKALENKLISAGVTKVGEGKSGEVTQEMKPGDILVFYDGNTAVHCAILGSGGTIYHATTSSGVTKSYTLKRWMELPDAKKNCDRYIVYRGLISTGSLTVLKTSETPDITDNNDCYSLAGAEYGLYRDETLVGKLVTDKDGRGTLANIPFGTYKLKELLPPKGYAIDEKEYDVTINSSTHIKEVKDVPQVNPVGPVLYKIDKEIHDAWSEENRGQAGATFSGALYVVSYYDDYYDETKDFDTIEPIRSWVISTDESGQAVMDDDNIVSGDELYTDDNGNAVFPLGTVMISEMKAPEGYLINDDSKVIQITSDGNDETVDTYKAPIHEEQVIRGDIKLIKIKDGTMERLAGVPFSVTSKSTGEVHVITTDANGYVSTSADWNLHTYDTNAGEKTSGLWFGNTEAVNDFVGAMPYDTYILDELPCDANGGLELIKGVEVRVYRNNTIIELGTITNDMHEKKTVERIVEKTTDNDAEVKPEIIKKDDSVDTGDDASGLILFISFSIMLAALAAGCIILTKS